MENLVFSNTVTEGVVGEAPDPAAADPDAVAVSTGAHRRCSSGTVCPRALGYLGHLDGAGEWVRGWESGWEGGRGGRLVCGHCERTRSLA